jgi:hypothetical protein
MRNSSNDILKKCADSLEILSKKNYNYFRITKLPCVYMCIKSFSYFIRPRIRVFFSHKMLSNFHRYTHTHQNSASHHTHLHIIIHSVLQTLKIIKIVLSIGRNLLLSSTQFSCSTLLFCFFLFIFFHSNFMLFCIIPNSMCN